MIQIRGHSWVFGANVTTEDILPNAYLDRTNAEVGQFAMAGIDPGFTTRVQTGDFVVGGPNFGIGSSRETAATALKLCGVGAIIAPSLGRVFYRNCINLGLPAIQIPQVDDIQQGDLLILDMESRIVTNTRSRQDYPVLNLSGVAWEILLAGGIIPFTKKSQAALLGDATS